MATRHDARRRDPVDVVNTTTVGAPSGPATAAPEVATTDAGVELPTTYEGLVARAKHRYVGPDVVRAVALIGVCVMNYHGYLIHRGAPVGEGWANRLFEPWEGPLATRFAATFVLIAGVGTTMLTASVAGNPVGIRARRLTLMRRGLLLFLGGMFLDVVWDGTILPYYGAMFVIGAVIFTWRTWAVAAFGTAAALAAMALRWFEKGREADGLSAPWLNPGGRWNPHALVVNTFVKGTHPLLPWLAFFCAGIILGRFLGRPAWRWIAMGGGFVLYAAGRLVATADPKGAVAFELTRDGPWHRSLPYVASALGTALIAVAAVTWLAERLERSWPVDALRHAGQMTLTLYVAHALVFNLVVGWLGWIRPTGLDTALVFAAGFWVVAIVVGSLWHRRFGIGPLEWVYREVSA